MKLVKSTLEKMLMHLKNRNMYGKEDLLTILSILSTEKPQCLAESRYTVFIESMNESRNQTFNL